MATALAQSAHRTLILSLIILFLFFAGALFGDSIFTTNYGPQLCFVLFVNVMSLFLSVNIIVTVCL